MINNLENSELYNLEKTFDKFIREFPNARRKLCQRTGQKLFEKVQENIMEFTQYKNDDGDWEEKTSGTLLDGVEMVVGSGGGYAAVKANHKIAPHTHLVENGHRIVVGKEYGVISAEKYGVKDTRKFTGNWVPGKHMYRNALNDLVFDLENDAQQTLYDLVGEVFG